MTSCTCDNILPVCIVLDGTMLLFLVSEAIALSDAVHSCHVRR